MTRVLEKKGLMKIRRDKMGRKNRRDWAHAKGQKDFQKNKGMADSNPFTAFFHPNYRPPSGRHREYKSGWDNAKKQHRKGGCFITTACVGARGLPDDCLELTTLRNFRDNYLRGLPDGERMIGNYYEVAPRIVAAIGRRHNAHELFCRIYGEDVARAVDLVLAGNFEGALSHYGSMVERLSGEFLE